MISHACIVPHAPILAPEVAGDRFQDVSSTTEAFHKLSKVLAEVKAETVLLISPHGPNQRRSFVVCSGPRARADLSRFRAPQVEFVTEIDDELTREVLEIEEATAAPAWGEGLDWGSSIPLYCLRDGIGSARLVLIGINGTEPSAHFQFGEALGQKIARHPKKVVVICSADLSHAVTPGAPCGYSPLGKVFDHDYEKAIAGWNVRWVLGQKYQDRREAAEDAVPQTSMLMGALNGRTVTPHVLSYEAPFGVGYLIADLEVA